MKTLRNESVLLARRSELPFVGFLVGTGVSFLLWTMLASIMWWLAELP